MINSSSLTLVAVAILYHQGKFLMQLRDNIPGIFYPGQWGLFGGHIETGETVEEGLKRELREEINYCPSSLTEFCCQREEQVIRWVYSAPLPVSLTQLKLQEGWDFKFVTPQEIEQGKIYSPKAEQFRLIGEPHQRLLRYFLTYYFREFYRV